VGDSTTEALKRSTTSK